MAEDPLKKKNPSTTLSPSARPGPSAKPPAGAQMQRKTVGAAQAPTAKNTVPLHQTYMNDLTTFRNRPENKKYNIMFKEEVPQADWEKNQGRYYNYATWRSEAVKALANRAKAADRSFNVQTALSVAEQSYALFNKAQVAKALYEDIAKSAPHLSVEDINAIVARNLQSPYIAWKFTPSMQQAHLENAFRRGFDMAQRNRSAHVASTVATVMLPGYTLMPGMQLGQRIRAWEDSKLLDYNPMSGFRDADPWNREAMLAEAKGYNHNASQITAGDLAALMDATALVKSPVEHFFGGYVTELMTAPGRFISGQGDYVHYDTEQEQAAEIQNNNLQARVKQGWLNKVDIAVLEKYWKEKGMSAADIERRLSDIRRGSDMTAYEKQVLWNDLLDYRRTTASWATGLGIAGYVGREAVATLLAGKAGVPWWGQALLAGARNSNIEDQSIIGRHAKQYVTGNGLKSWEDGTGAGNGADAENTIEYGKIAPLSKAINALPEWLQTPATVVASFMPFGDLGISDQDPTIVRNSSNLFNTGKQFLFGTVLGGLGSKYKIKGQAGGMAGLGAETYVEEKIKDAYPSLRAQENQSLIKNTQHSQEAQEKRVETEYKAVNPNAPALSRNEMYAATSFDSFEVKARTMQELGIDTSRMSEQQIRDYSLNAQDKDKLADARFKATKALITEGSIPDASIWKSTEYTAAQKQDMYVSAMAAAYSRTRYNNIFKIITGSVTKASDIGTILQKDEKARYISGQYLASVISSQSEQGAEMPTDKKSVGKLNAIISNLGSVGEQALYDGLKDMSADTMLSAIKKMKSGESSAEGNLLTEQSRTVLGNTLIRKVFEDREFGRSFIPKFYKHIADGGAGDFLTTASKERFITLLNTHFGDVASANAWFEGASADDIMGFITTFANKENQDKLIDNLPEGVNKAVASNIKKAVTKQAYKAFIADPIKNGPVIIDTALQQVGLGLGPAKDSPLLFYGGLATLLTLGGTALSGFSKDRDSGEAASGYEDFKRDYYRYEPQTFEDAMDY